MLTADKGKNMKSVNQHDCIRAGSRALIRAELASRIQIQV